MSQREPKKTRGCLRKRDRARESDRELERES